MMGPEWAAVGSVRQQGCSLVAKRCDGGVGEVAFSHSLPRPYCCPNLQYPRKQLLANKLLLNQRSNKVGRVS